MRWVIYFNRKVRGEYMLMKLVRLIKRKKTQQSEANMVQEEFVTSGAYVNSIVEEVFFTSDELKNNGMVDCIEFDNAVSSCEDASLIKFIEKIVPGRREELTIAFYGISPKNRFRMLNAMTTRQAAILLEDMSFFEKGATRTKGKESINKSCRIMLDFLTGKETIEEFKIEEFTVSCGTDPMIQYENYILDAPEKEIKLFSNRVNQADLSVASYYLSDKAKDRLFCIIGDEMAALIKEDHSFMDNPSKQDVSAACENIIKEFDVYWSM